MVPVGRFTLPCAMAFCTSSMPTPRAASLRGLTRTRTAYFCEPKTLTWATPEMVDSRCASCVSAYSFRRDIGMLGELMAMKKIGKSPGFTLRKDGGDGMLGGSF